MIIHKTWCGACKSLKAAVAKDEAIAKFSSNLVMVNLEDDEVSGLNSPDHVSANLMIVYNRG